MFYVFLFGLETLVPLRVGFLYGQTATSAEPGFLENPGSVEVGLFVRQNTNVNGTRVSGETLVPLRLVLRHTKTPFSTEPGFSMGNPGSVEVGVFVRRSTNLSGTRVSEKPRFRCNRPKPR